HGHLQADGRGRGRRAPRWTVVLALALHVASIAGIVYAVAAATWQATDTAPGRERLPGEMEPLPDNCRAIARSPGLPLAEPPSVHLGDIVRQRDHPHRGTPSVDLLGVFDLQRLTRSAAAAQLRAVALSA